MNSDFFTSVTVKLGNQRAQQVRFLWLGWYLLVVMIKTGVIKMPKVGPEGALPINEFISWNRHFLEILPFEGKFSKKLVQKCNNPLKSWSSRLPKCKRLASEIGIFGILISPGYKRLFWERLFLEKKWKRLSITIWWFTRKGMLLSRAKRVIEGPLSVNHQRLIERLYFFARRDFL